MKYLIILISLSCFANEFHNRFSIGDFGYSTLEGNLYSLEYIRLFGENHAGVFRTNQATKSSGSEYMIGYRYYFAKSSRNDSSFLEVGYKRDRDLKLAGTIVTGTFPNLKFHDQYETKSSDLARAVFGYQWVFSERINFDIGAGYEQDISGGDGSQVTGVLSIGLLF